MSKIQEKGFIKEKHVPRKKIQLILGVEIVKYVNSIVSFISPKLVEYKASVKKYNDNVRNASVKMLMQPYLSQNTVIEICTS